MSFRDFKDKVDRYFGFDREEVKGIIIAALIFAFIISYKEWGYGQVFEVGVGLKNFVNAAILSLLAILVHETGHKLSGVYTGFKVQTKIWWYGMGIALIVCFLSRGNIWFLALSGITLHHLAIQRLGKFRYGERPVELSMIAIAGPLANIILATLLKTTIIWFPSLPINAALVHKAFIINWAMAISNLLPIPPLDGIHTFFQSRLFYISIFGFMAGYGALIYFGIYSWIWALVIAGIAWILFYVNFERGAM